MKINDLNTAKVPIVKFDKSLERFRGKVLFPEKLELANKLLANIKLPKYSNRYFPAKNSISV